MNDATSNTSPANASTPWPSEPDEHHPTPPEAFTCSSHVGNTATTKLSLRSGG